ncbi:hypothetical protein [Pedobacter frigoris]|uniref:hypothetical protein n=1 Tax=Pedobacter frigoris TaxID=2571272 RepID=UPI00292FB1E1|nr:hypothetical protein [Pedobacter frigoris]
MKNVFKSGFLALVVSLTVAACGGSEKKAGDMDSTKMDSTMTMSDSATTSMDTTVIVDTTAKDSVKK